MEKQNPILQELSELNSSLGNSPSLTPYKVPPGYFDQLPAQMYAIASWVSMPSALTGLSTPYTVPAGYFNDLPSVILNKICLSVTETQENAEQVETIFAEISAAEELAAISPLLGGIGKKTPFAVPDNYFSRLTGEVVSGIRDESSTGEPETLSPVLQDLKAVNVFQVPPSYFDAFPSKMMALVKPAAPSMVVRGNFGSRIVRYAAAAVVTGLMVTAGFFLMNRNNDSAQIVSTNALEEKASQASDEEILRYLEIQPVPIPDSLITTDREIKDDAILDMLADVSDEELQQYLQLQSDTKLLIN